MAHETQQDGPVLDADAFVAANIEWLRDFAWGGLEVRPSRRMAILTCMDSRYTAQGVLGVALGEAHVIRNAGGRVTDDAIRSLVLSAHALGTRGCVLIHHTNCGLHGTSNEAIWGQVREATGEDASGIDFLPFDDTAESVREDLARLRACRLFPAGYQVLGFVYDVRTGRLEPIEG
ncbi:MAG: carbonic anhydrase [Dehalococcoidia bacterium]